MLRVPERKQENFRGRVESVSFNEKVTMSGQDDAFEGEWQEKWSETHNRVYYKNKITGERQWKKPAGMMGNNTEKVKRVGHRASVDAYGIEELKRNGMFSDNTNYEQYQTTAEDYSSHTVEPVIQYSSPATEYHREYNTSNNDRPSYTTGSVNKLFSKEDSNESAPDNMTVIITDHTGRRRSITKTDPNAPTPPPPPPPPSFTQKAPPSSTPQPPPSSTPKPPTSLTPPPPPPSSTPQPPPSSTPQSLPSTTPPSKSDNSITPEETASHLRRSSVSRRQSMTPKQVDFPLICIKCFGLDPLVPMVKVVNGKNCFFCATLFTTFSFNTQKDVRKPTSIKSTQSCRLCASMKDFCQVCFGPMAVNAEVSDEALKQVEEVIVPILPYQKLDEIDEHHGAYVRRASITPQQARRQSMNQQNEEAPPQLGTTPQARRQSVNKFYDGSNSNEATPPQGTSPQARRQSVNQHNDSDDDTPTMSNIYPQARRQSVNKFYDGSNSNEAAPRRQSINKFYDGSNSNDATPPQGTSPQARRQSVNKFYDGSNSNTVLSSAPQGRRPSMGQPYEGSGSSEVLRRLSIQQQTRRQSINDTNASEKVEPVRRQSTTQQAPTTKQNPNITYQNEDDDSSDEETKCIIV